MQLGLELKVSLAERFHWRIGLERDFKQQAWRCGLSDEDLEVDGARCVYLLVDV